jgi:hypothetical protein
MGAGHVVSWQTLIVKINLFSCLGKNNISRRKYSIKKFKFGKLNPKDYLQIESLGLLANKI